METPALDDRLAQWAIHLERLQWSAIILDSEWRLAWVSTQLRDFIGATEDSDLGYGLHIVEAFVKDAWLRTVAPESQIEMFNDLAPFMVTDLSRRGRTPEEILPERFLPLVEAVEPAPIPYVWSSSFLYIDPDEDQELPAYRVNLCFLRLHQEDGEFLGWLILFYMGVQPNLLSLLARGDERMYDRMAKLVEPSPRQAAILFCDLHHSGRLSRQLPSATYFKLIRRLWTGIDAAVAEDAGIVGRYAGEGASAFYLVDDAGSPSEAAAAALRTARRIHEISERVFGEVADTDCMMKVGIHWGGSLYMGQLVPGGRLDVTALGDEVNEAALLQESAGPGETLVSKQLLEQLDPDAAAALGIEPEKVLYEPLASLGAASEKARQDAGGVAVTTV